jgi:heme/copper-type cytochrome/quinol oxidase subunit 3
MNEQRALDVSALPTFAFGNRSILWWGTMGIVAIEGTMFAIVCASYLFLRWRVPEWPPALAPPDLRWGAATTIVLLVSALPNHLAKKAAERMDLERVRLWMVVCIALALAFSVFRALEFTTLNCWYDTNAYASVVWLLLGLHTAHILTDIVDTVLLATLMFVGPVEGKRFVDVAENSLYWYFVVVTWLPIYALIYFAPRVL